MLLIMWVIKVLKSFHDAIDSLAFLYAHCGSRADQGNHVYSLSAAVIKPGSPTEVFESLVRYDSFGGRERLRSSLSRGQLSSAPKPEKVSNEIRKFLAKSPFLFTLNDVEEYEWVQKFTGLKRIVDLNLAAQFFLPDIPSSSFNGFWEFLREKKRAKRSFAASELVALSTELLKHICGVRLNDKAFPHARTLRYFLKESDTLFGRAFLHTTCNYNRYFGGLFSPCSLSDTNDWQQFLQEAVSKKTEKPENTPYEKISLKEISSRYQALSENQAGFQFRPSQRAFAGCVTESINENAILCLEAGTGTGKTLGYLIPVLDFLAKNPEARVAISTYTKNLQEQVFQREVSFAREHFKLYRNIPTSVLKGKSSYLCTRKLDYLIDEHVTGIQRLAWLYLVNLCYHFEKADVDSTGDLLLHYLNGDGFLSHALRSASAREGCSPTHHNCPAQVVTARARDSRLVITNHHKLALLDRDPVLGGLFRNYLIDEANHFEHAVRNAYREEIASRDVLFSISYLEKFGERLSQKASGENLRLLEDLKTVVSKVYSDFNKLHSILASLSPPHGGGEERALPSQHSRFEYGHIVNHFKKIRASTVRIQDLLKEFLDEDRRRVMKIAPRTVGRMNNETQFLATFIESLSLFESAFDVPNRVQTFRVFRKNFILASVAVEAGELVRNQVYQNRDWIVYTAATLQFRDSFDVFRKIVGLDKDVETEGEPRCLKFKAIPSPFDPRNMKFLIPEDVVSGNHTYKERWLNYLVRMIPALVKENKGRTLVLFASYSDLNHVAKAVSEQISDAMMPLLIQKPGRATIHLCDDFMAVKDSVLFGVDTFWYGVDFKGDTLTQVIITRIPYPSISNPLQTARKALLPPKEYSERLYYDMDTKLRQGIGRLIRSHTDRGRVVILDSRKTAREYADRHAVIAGKISTPPVLMKVSGSGIENENRKNSIESETVVKAHKKTEETTQPILESESDTVAISRMDILKRFKNTDLRMNLNNGRIREYINEILEINEFPHETTVVRILRGSGSERMTEEMEDLSCWGILAPSKYPGLRAKDIRAFVRPVVDEFKEESKKAKADPIFQRQEGAIRSRLEKDANVQDDGSFQQPTGEYGHQELRQFPKDTSVVAEPELENNNVLLVCLANSRKLSGRCIAGKIFTHGIRADWVRPVSSRVTGELSNNEISFQQGGPLKLLDIISLKLLSSVSHPYQSENWLNDVKTSWERVGELAEKKLDELCDEPNTLWLNGYHSYNGLNDRFPVEIAREHIVNSLRFIKPESMIICVEEELNGKIKVRCRFAHNGETYALVVTDPVAEKKYLEKGNGEYPMNSKNTYLCISIGEPYQGFCYKLAAGIIVLKD